MGSEIRKFKILNIGYNQEYNDNIGISKSLFDDIKRNIEDDEVVIIDEFRGTWCPHNEFFYYNDFKEIFVYE